MTTTEAHPWVALLPDPVGAVLAALGPGWEVGYIDRRPVLTRRVDGTLASLGMSSREYAVTVEHFAEGTDCAVDCDSPQAAVTVAHLLLAADAIARGAEVAQREDVDVTDDGMIEVLDDGRFSPPEARAFAVDLLQAAAQAEGAR